MALTTSATTPASKATPRNGFGGASAVWPALSSSRITPANPDASAKAPWTRTTVGPGMGSSSGLERWPQRRYVTGPEPVGPGGAPPGTQPVGLCRSTAMRPPPASSTEPAGRPPQEWGGGQELGPPPPTRLPIANVHADRRISICKSNLLYSASASVGNTAEDASRPVAIGRQPCSNRVACQRVNPG